jgi:hypothetical protein
MWQPRWGPEKQGGRSPDHLAARPGVGMGARVVNNYSVHWVSNSAPIVGAEYGPDTNQ